jgi:uncharacterized protein YyaL (SSP411 family)
LSRAFAGNVKASPAAHTFFLLGVDFALGPAYNIILVGEPNEKDTLTLLKPLKEKFLPNMAVSVKTPGKTGFGYEKIGEKATAYVCRDQTCMPPTNDPGKMIEFLS